MPNPNQPSKRRRSMTPKPSIAFLNTLLLFLSLLVIVFLLLRQSSTHYRLHYGDPISFSAAASATERRHIFFAVASSAASYPRRKPYVRLWFIPNYTHAIVFLDRNDLAGDGVRWFVFGDDDMVFFVENLVRTVEKYDHEKGHWSDLVKNTRERLALEDGIELVAPSEAAGLARAR